MANLKKEPWNKGIIVGQKKPFKIDEIITIRTNLELKKKIRDAALFNLGIDSKLRASDLVKLKVKEITHGNKINKRVTIIQQKTKLPVSFEITKKTRKSLSKWIKLAKLNHKSHLFPSAKDKSRHLSTRQLHRLVTNWATSISLDKASYGTHSLRRSKVCLLYKATKDLRACQLLLGHKDISKTIEYLGVEVNDALEISEKIEF